MRILLIHNCYGTYSGEEAAVEQCRDLLVEYGHTVIPYYRSSKELDGGVFSKIRAGISGIKNMSAVQEVERLVDQTSPDLAHVHNLYPIISPAVLPALKAKHVPIVMTVHNFRLLCPNGLFYTHGEVCERCVPNKEYWCVLRNCERSVPKSFAYALRNFVARTQGHYLHNVDIFLALTEFQKAKLAMGGYPESKIRVLPSIASKHALRSEKATGASIGFIGRLSEQKGIDIFYRAAAQLPNYSFVVAGEPTGYSEGLGSKPENVEHLGFVQGYQLDEFYDNCRAIVICSRSYEGFPIVLIEAMARGKVVICPDIGGLPEIVGHGKAGVLYSPGDDVDLATKIDAVCQDGILSRKLGEHAVRIARQLGSRDHYCRKLLDYYCQAQNSQKL